MSTARTKLGIGNSSICPSALAPMQDVTGLPFMSLVAERLVFYRILQSARKFKAQPRNPLLHN